MSAAMPGRCKKIKNKKTKKHWLKRPKAVLPKEKFGPKYKWFKISYLKLFFWKNFFGHKIFLYWSTRCSGHHQSFFLISDFLVESLKASKIYRKSHSFYNIVLLKKPLTHYMNLNSLDAVATQPKNFLNLLKIFCLVSEKNICTPPFFDAQNCILEALWKQMSVYFCIYP